MGVWIGKSGFYGLILALSAACLPGCIFKELSNNLDQIDRAGRVELSVDGQRFGDHPVLAVLIRDDEAVLTVETYGIVPEADQLTLYCPPGDYLLLAFQDVNRNERYDTSEPFAMYGRPTPLEIWDGRKLNDLVLTLTLPVNPKAWSPKELANRQVEISPRLTEFGKVLSLDDPRFERDIARMGMWRPAQFINENNAGLYMLQAYDPEKIPVVFVHGIGGSPRHFEAIVANLDHDKFQPWVFYYPSAMRLQMLGDYLQIAIERLRTFHNPEHVFVVAHSMGGLVAWAGVRAHLKAFPDEPYIDLLVTLNSPLGGMQSASAGVDYAPVVMPSWVDLDPRSDFLAALYADPLPESLPYYLFYGVAEANSWLNLNLPVELEMLLSGDIVLDGEDADDKTVALDSQLHRPAAALATAISGHQADHMGILETPQVLYGLNKLLDQAHQRVTENTPAVP